MVAAGAPRSLSREIHFYDDEVLSCRIASGQFHKLNAFLQVVIEESWTHLLQISSGSWGVMLSPFREGERLLGDTLITSRVPLWLKRMNLKGMKHTFAR
ncbi:hypothetical protein BHE74_00003567 [Ensete ventricosum]|nr:hypothetical protein BHE74_00003567 [Ensete ventricosum]